ncbi:hypothetical protein IFR04_008451 [Cadophora malorum]|uniref:CCHC-type domain-containing protein n=1 Tax=Cadophora malorum TaxID=108018 RepID=A0A8H7TB88_9HELO|nr:hypothetical protein IFR04_008451 [Cadophora malorum]
MFIQTPPHSKTNDEDYISTVATALKDIRDHKSFHELPGFVYYDRFLRFLNTIGPLNTSCIKVRRFGGVCMRHRYCRQDTCGKGCDVDLMDCLRAFIPFINRFCTGLEKLVLHTKEDRHFERDPSYQIDGMPKSREEAILPFLQNEVRQLSTLKELEVYDGFGSKSLDYAKPTMDWFKDRAAKKARKVREAHIRMQILKAQANEDNVHCAFCGEGHVWVDCYNLCKFCGDFGHFAKTCPHTK